MSKFPSTEGNLLVLANEISSGLTNHSTVYPAPPVPSADLDMLIDAVVAAQNAATDAKAAAEAATVTKTEAMEAIVEAMKKDLRYAENTVDYDDEKLKLIGWSGRKPRTALEKPGQARQLVATEQGESWVKLEWKKPDGGGMVSAYRIQRRQLPEGSWQETATAMDKQITLDDQPRGVELEYRIIAANKAGDGMASNAVMAVL